MVPDLWCIDEFRDLQNRRLKIIGNYAVFVHPGWKYIMIICKYFIPFIISVHFTLL